MVSQRSLLVSKSELLAKDLVYGREVLKRRVLRLFELGGRTVTNGYFVVSTLLHYC